MNEKYVSSIIMMKYSLIKKLTIIGTVSFKREREKKKNKKKYKQFDRDKNKSKNSDY